MKKFITPSYAFSPGPSGVGFINLSGVSDFNIKNLVSIINQTKGIVIYATGSQNLKYTNVTGTTVTLFADTSSMSSGDTLQVIYEDNSALTVEPILIDKDGNEIQAKATASGATAIGNTLSKFRDNFVLGAPDLTVWDEQFTNQGSTFVTKGGEAGGSSFLKISMCPYTAGSQYILTSKEAFKPPFNLGFSITESQRLAGQEFVIGIAGVDSNGVIQRITTKPDTALPASVSISSFIATINFTTAHSFKGGDRVVIINCLDNRLNVGPVLVSVITDFQITIPITLPAATYTSTNGFIRLLDPVDNLFNGAVMNTGDSFATGQVLATIRRNGSSFRGTNFTISPTNGTAISGNNFTESFLASNNLEIIPTSDDILFTTRSADTTTLPGTTLRYSQSIPDDSIDYKLFIKALNNPRIPRPIAKIVSAVKSGSVNALITTDVPHGLNSLSRVNIYGIRDTTNFPVITTVTPVVSIVSPTQFTVAIGASTSGSSTGGRVDLCEGNQVINSQTTQSIQSVSRTSNLITFVFSASISTIAQGETAHIYGCDAGSMGLYDGPYLVRRVSGTSVIMESIGPDFASINCGGSLLRRTDYRLHTIRVNDFTRTIVELSNTASSDPQRALPVAQQGTATVLVTGTATVSVSNSPSVSLQPAATSSIFSSTLTTSGVSSSITSGRVSSLFNVIVSTVGGTNPTLDLVLEETYDTAISWRPVYHFPRITSASSFIIPVLAASGSNYRFSYSVSGSSPTFPVTITPSVSNTMVTDFCRKFFNRTLDINTLSAVSPSFTLLNAQKVQLVASILTATTAPTLQLEGSIDNGSTWFNLGTTLTTLASSTVELTFPLNADLVRVKVSSAGSGATLNYICIRSF